MASIQFIIYLIGICLSLTYPVKLSADVSLGDGSAILQCKQQGGEAYLETETHRFFCECPATKREFDYTQFHCDDDLRNFCDHPAFQIQEFREWGKKKKRCICTKTSEPITSQTPLGGIQDCIDTFEASDLIQKMDVHRNPLTLSSDHCPPDLQRKIDILSDLQKSEDIDSILKNVDESELVKLMVQIERELENSSSEQVRVFSKFLTSKSGEQWKVKITSTPTGIVALDFGTQIGRGGFKIAKSNLLFRDWTHQEKKTKRAVTYEYRADRRAILFDFQDERKRHQNQNSKLRELELLQILSHNKQIGLIKVYAASEQGAIVRAYERDLHEALFQNSDEGEHRPAAMTRKAKLELLEQIAQGVLNLHRLGYIHRDLKLSQILIRKKKNGSTEAAVGDVGLAALINTPIGPAGTRRYMPPEAFKVDQKANPKSDVFSLGLLTWELLHETKIPLAQTGKTIGNSFLSRWKFKHKLNYSDPLERLIYKSLDSNPKNRPSMEEFLETVENELYSCNSSSSATHKLPKKPGWMDFFRTPFKVTPE